MHYLKTMSAPLLKIHSGGRRFVHLNKYAILRELGVNFFMARSTLYTPCNGVKNLTGTKYTTMACTHTHRDQQMKQSGK